MVLILIMPAEVKAQLRYPHIIEQAQELSLRNLQRHLRFFRPNRDALASLASAMDVISLACESGELQGKYFALHGQQQGSPLKQ